MNVTQFLPGSTYFLLNSPEERGKKRDGRCKYVPYVLIPRLDLNENSTSSVHTFNKNDN